MIFRVSFLKDRKYFSLRMTNGVLVLLFSTGSIEIENQIYHLSEIIKITRLDDDENIQ
jgi:hypothetical protein